MRPLANPSHFALPPRTTPSPQQRQPQPSSTSRPPLSPAPETLSLRSTLLRYVDHMDRFEPGAPTSTRTPSSSSSDTAAFAIDPPPLLLLFTHRAFLCLRGEPLTYSPLLASSIFGRSSSAIVVVPFTIARVATTATTRKARCRALHRAPDMLRKPTYPSAGSCRAPQSRSRARSSSGSR